MEFQLSKNQINSTINFTRFPNIAIIDTSVLIDFLLINFKKNGLIKSNFDLINKIDALIAENCNDVKAYEQLMNKIQTFVTSSQVMGELQGLFKSKQENKLYQINPNLFWAKSVEFLQYKNLDEQLISVLKVADSPDFNNFIYRIGYVDTGLIHLALDNQLPIITKDYKTLSIEANYQNIRVINP